MSTADPNVVAADELLGTSTLAAAELAGWDPATCVLRLAVIHLEHPQVRFGEISFLDVSYVQLPIRTSWGYGVRLALGASLPSRGDLDSTDVVYELFSRDGAEPSAFVVARALRVERYEGSSRTTPA